MERAVRGHHRRGRHDALEIILADISITVGGKAVNNGSAVEWAAGANSVKIEVTAAVRRFPHAAPPPFRSALPVSARYSCFQTHPARRPWHSARTPSAGCAAGRPHCADLPHDRRRRGGIPPGARAGRTVCPAVCRTKAGHQPAVPGQAGRGSSQPADFIVRCRIVPCDIEVVFQICQKPGRDILPCWG